MNALLILGVSSFLIALILTPLCRNLFRHFGMVDHPDQVRKLHARSIPNMGGIPIAAAYLAGFGALMVFGAKVHAATVDASLALKLLAAGGIVLAAGALDDYFRLQPAQKLMAQIGAAAVAFSAGVRITGIAGHPLSLTWSFLATVLWLIACMNAFNLIDGLDGLAAGVGLFATATTLVAALLQHNLALAAATVPLAGALLGFLRYNFNPATMFLGDSGSQLVGFLLGSFGVIWSQKSATLLGMTAPLMALSIPILDTGLSILRRFLRRQPILRGDRGHIHHRLVALGFSPKEAVLVLYAGAGVFAGFSVLQSMTTNHYSGAVILVFCAVTWIGIQNLGYAEFDQARRMVLGGGFREALNVQLALRAFRDSLAAAKTTGECWVILREATRQFGFSGVRWSVNGVIHSDEVARFTDAVWQLRVPLSGDDYINFNRPPSSESPKLNVGEFVETVRAVLGSERWPASVEPSIVEVKENGECLAGAASYFEERPPTLRA